MSGKNTQNTKTLGDYRMFENIDSDGRTAVWLAEQVSIGRNVLVEELLDPTPDNREEFLAETRARAAVDHPFIASVYEAVDASDFCFRATECLTGPSLQAMADAGTRLEPVHLTRALRSLAEANLHHETHGRATQPLTLHHIHLDGKNVTRIANLATTGLRHDDESARDVARLGHDMVPLVATNRPGTTRMHTVLAWMRGKDRPAPLQWQEIINLCNQIETQLAAPIGPPPGARRASHGTRNTLLVLGVFMVVALAAIMLFAVILRPAGPTIEVIERPPPVLIPAGDHPTPDGGSAPHQAFLIDARETTIAEYREFLEILAVLSADGRHRAFDHPSQPAEKSGHQPDDWPALLAAARARGEWNGHPVSLNSPVPGVDWWDAMAYANWRKARLPTLAEWSAAVHHETESPEAIAPGRWHPEIPTDCADVTATGIHGVAGSLREWIRDPSPNPANPLGRPQHIIIGGSHLATGQNALTREWVADPATRAPDLGFRLVRDVAE